MDLHLFRTFLAVYRTGSVGAAARLLPVGEDEVAAAVRELEGHVGRPLFENHDGALVPTAYADALAREAGPPMDALRTLMARVETEHAGIGDAPVRLGGPREYLIARVLPELADLVAAGLRLGLPGSSGARAGTDRAGAGSGGPNVGSPGGYGVEDLIEDRLDLVIVEGRLRRRGVLARPLGGEELALVAAPSWARRLRPAIVKRLPDLAGVPLLGAPHPQPLHDPLRPAPFDRAPARVGGAPSAAAGPGVGPGPGPGADADADAGAGLSAGAGLTASPGLGPGLDVGPGVGGGPSVDDVGRYWDAVFGVAPPRPFALTCADRGALVAAVVAGAGVTVLPWHLCAGHVRRGELVVLYEPEPAPVERYSLVMRTGPATPAVATVRDRLLTRLGTATPTP